jgi:DNA repair protein RadC
MRRWLVSKKLILDKIKRSGAENLTIVENLNFLTSISQQKVLKLLEEYSLTELEKFLHALHITDEQKAKLEAMFSFRRHFNETLILKEECKMESDQIAGKYFINLLGNLCIEKFYAAFLDKGKRLIKSIHLSTGTIDKTSICPRMIIENALFLGASSVVLAHNHPNGSVGPGFSDREATRIVKEKLKVLDIDLDDHIIVSGNSYYSMGAYGLI